MKTIAEQSPVGVSASSGVVDRAIQPVQGILRTLRSALEARWKMLVPVEHPVLPWMVEHAPVILNKCEVGKDGKTSHERVEAKKTTLLGVEFGEDVLFHRRLGQAKLAKLSSLWEDGMFTRSSSCQWRKRCCHREGHMEDQDNAKKTRGD